MGRRARGSGGRCRVSCTLLVSGRGGGDIPRAQTVLAWAGRGYAPALRQSSASPAELAQTHNPAPALLRNSRRHITSALAG